MISAHIRDAVIALLAVDKSATDDERETVARALAGQPISTGPAVLSFKEVCQKLGRSRQGVYNLISRGLLKPVKGGGAAGLNCGITADSLDRYLRGA